MLLLLGICALLWLAQAPSVAFGVHTLHPDDQALKQVRDLGAQYVVQVFSWSEIEPSPGEFHWEYTDWLVRAADYYRLKVVARLDKTPAWAAASPLGLNSPPSRVQDYIDFVGQVAARYNGRIAGYIIWNEPNLAQEWGGHRPDAAAYAGLLEAASSQIRAIDPQARVLSAGLAPTNDNGDEAQDDKSYLRAVYAAGAKASFDVLAAHPYGFDNAPDDPRGAHAGLNYMRLEDLRDIMVQNGDAAKPVWITEFGYSTSPPTNSSGLQVTEAQQAEYLVRAFSIARERWNWVRLFTVWNLPGIPAGESLQETTPNPNSVGPLPNAPTSPSPDQEAYGLIRPDGSAKPAFGALRDLPKISEWARIVQALSDAMMPKPSKSEFTVLARDSIIHLGDSEYPAPWVPLYQDRNPASDWQGEFYLEKTDLEGPRRTRRWLLTMELMQVNDFDSTVAVNGRPVSPAYLPAEDDFTSVWISAQFEVPPTLLAEGRNVVRVHDGKLFPAFQQLGFTWDDFQFRNVILAAP